MMTLGGVCDGSGSGSESGSGSGRRRGRDSRGWMMRNDEIRKKKVMKAH
jgi:hypothetical protein